LAYYKKLCEWKDCKQSHGCTDSSCCICDPAFIAALKEIGFSEKKGI